MAIWELTTEHKKSSVEIQVWRKDGNIVIREEGYRWGTFTVESDEMPVAHLDLIENDEYELGCIENDNCWEMDELSDGCWSEITKGHTCTDEALEEFTTAWEDNYYEGVEDLGWSHDDTEYYMTGPLKLTNLDTGEEYSGLVDPTTIVRTIELPKAVPVLTDWYPSKVNPSRIGAYQAMNDKEETKWPLGPNTFSATWDGKKWDQTIKFWRGLAKDPNE